MIKVKVYGGEDTVEEECELLAVCGFTRPGGILYQFRTDFSATKSEIFACLTHLSAQLQAAARDAMQEAIRIAEEEGVEFDDKFMKPYEDIVYGLEKQINRNVGPEHGKEVAEDDAED